MPSFAAPHAPESAYQRSLAGGRAQTASTAPSRRWLNHPMETRCKLLRLAGGESAIRKNREPTSRQAAEFLPAERSAQSSRQTRSLPSALARYISASARANKACGDSFGLAVARPMLTVTGASTPTADQSTSASAARSCAQTSRPWSSDVSGSAITSSSPPNLATMSDLRRACCNCRAIATSTASPTACERVSLIRLKLSTSRSINASGRTCRSAREHSRASSVSSARRFSSPVSASSRDCRCNSATS